MTARDIILRHIRERLGQKTTETAFVEREAEDLLTDIESARPALEALSLPDVFISHASAEKVGASIDRISEFDELPSAVQNYLLSEGLELQTILQPDPVLLALNWSPISIAKDVSPDHRVVVQKALWAIAETGTLVFHSSPTSPTLLSYLPLYDIVVIEADKILAYLEDYTDMVRDVPRNVNFVTGPSGTTDIEGTLIRGAHGPGYLHIIIIGN